MTPHYNYFRDYDPTIGRYFESDPLGLAGGINTYSYVQGNPLGRVDDYGLVSWPLIAVGAGAGGYLLWHKYDKQKKCETLCPFQCDIKACGDPERSAAYQDNQSRCITTCKSECFFEAWGIGPKAGPRPRRQ